jgi:hypothetical protein
LLAGGALWNWTDGGFQYVDDHDVGRLIQSSVFWLDSSANFLNGYKYMANPDEGGGASVGTPSDATDMFGSPVLSASDPGGATGTTQSTRAIPLEWQTSVWGGGAANPVIWQSMRLGKDLTLNYGGLGYDVAQYKTQLYTPTSLNNYNDGLGKIYPPNIEIPAAFFAASTFTNFYEYDPTTTPTQLTAESPTAGGDPIRNKLTNGYGGIILADSTGTHAFGMYGASTSSGGSVTESDMQNLSNLSSNLGPTMKLGGVNANTTSLPSGWSSYTTYLMSGTLAAVQTDMNGLYAAGAK